MLILYGIFSMPDCWLKKYIIENPAVGITLYLVIGVLIVLLYVAILNKASSMEKRFGEYLCSIAISSDEVLLIGGKYDFDGALRWHFRKDLGTAHANNPCVRTECGQRKRLCRSHGRKPYNSHLKENGNRY